MYPDPRVARFVQDNFRPVRVHVREQADEFRRLGERYGVQWTPTILIIDPTSAEERYRVEGFLPADELVTQLTLGLGHAAFKRSDFAEAERRLREVVDNYPNSEAAAEALYWAGASRYKSTGDAGALAETATEFTKRYQNTTWAKKASVWRR